MIAKRTNENVSKDGPLEPACREQVREVGWDELPLSCPTAEMEIWNAHPREYLPIHRTGREQCEWCGTVYVLKPPDPDRPPPTFCNIEIENRYRQALARLQSGRDDRE
ncbi:MAG: hypothetical protein RQ847_11960 [Wenzhouxiangellaceae bacterium]|nr:hypothetical protein [Wenzhouxiangellaceae bacterium]